MSEKNIVVIVGVLWAFASITACSNEGVGPTTAPLSASCVADAAELAPDDWLCSNPAVYPVECEDGQGEPTTIFFEPTEELSETVCSDIRLSLQDGQNKAGPFPMRDEPHDVVVTAEAYGESEPSIAVECPAQLRVEDTVPPEAVAEAIELWPPNHKFHTIVGEDCVVDACDGEDVQVTFLWASSDEPVDENGDGNTEPDIILACDRVRLRSERQGESNGRVYRLGYEAVDRSGNPTEGECLVTVPHDQSGREAFDDGEGNGGYTIALKEDECADGMDATVSGDGEVAEPNIVR